ncbi:MAG: hypothetical protein HYY24_08635 [Verrucomicrobia bacterium]|nr:hypothetical protein [Verrucomicrobiota bacterium]
MIGFDPFNPLASSVIFQYNPEKVTRRLAIQAAGAGASGDLAENGDTNPREEKGAMSTFPGSPRLLKVAIIGLEPFSPLASVVDFQYNPATMTRRLAPPALSSEGDRGEAFLLTGAPKETIALSIKSDASDQFDQVNLLVTTIGTCPKLANPFPRIGIFFSNAAKQPKPTPTNRS